MTYIFKQAVHYSRGRKARRAIYVHMAEGGGTVSWLQNPKNPNVSAHYVVEYTGRVVQMVSEADSAWGINPSMLRTTNDTAFTFLGESVRYGVTAAKAALGSYWYDPNAAGITIEVEGYAKDGPNAKQRAALAALIRDIRTRYPKLPVLGHRDFQNYKACPGHKVAWVDFGGHGKAVNSPVAAPTTGGTDVNSFTAFTHPSKVSVPKGVWLYDNSDLNPSTGNVNIDPPREMPYLGHFSATVGIVAYIPSGAVPATSKAMFVRRSDVSAPAPIPFVDDDGITQATVDGAVAAQKAADKTIIDGLTAKVNEGLATIASQAATIADLRTRLAAAEAAKVAAEAAQKAAEALSAKAEALSAALRVFLGL